MNGFRLLRPVVFCLMLSLLHSTEAVAQKSFALAFGGGAAIPVGKLSDTQKTGYNALAALAIGVAELPLGLRFDGVYNDLRRSNGVTAQPGAAAPSDFRVIGALANLVYAFSGNSVKPYAIFGGGLYNSKADMAGAKSHNDFGFNAGLGLTFGFGPFATFVESRYHSISRNAEEGGVFQFVPITFGLMF